MSNSPTRLVQRLRLLARGPRAAGRRIAIFFLALAAAAGLVAAAAPAYADGAPKYCSHGGGTTTIMIGLTLTTTPSITADSYVQRWNGSNWYYMQYSNGSYVMQRAYSTTDGWWMTPSGTRINTVMFNLSPNSGYYRYVTHVYSTRYGYDTGWIANSGYVDNLRGTTSWCQA